MTHRRSSSSKISRKSRRKTKTEKKHNKWFQRGCQNKSARKGGQNGQNGQIDRLSLCYAPQLTQRIPSFPALRPFVLPTTLACVMRHN